MSAVSDRGYADDYSPAAAAIAALLAAARKRSRTIQWMPAEFPAGSPERFEVIVVATGDVEYTAAVDAEGIVSDHVEVSTFDEGGGDTSELAAAINRRPGRSGLL